MPSCIKYNLQHEKFKGKIIAQNYRVKSISTESYMSQNLREEKSYKRKLEGKIYKTSNYNRRYYQKNLQDKKTIEKT